MRQLKNIRCSDQAESAGGTVPAEISEKTADAVKIRAVNDHHGTVGDRVPGHFVYFRDIHREFYFPGSFRICLISGKGRNSGCFCHSIRICTGRIGFPENFFGFRGSVFGLQGSVFRLQRSVFRLPVFCFRCHERQDLSADNIFFDTHQKET